MISSFSLCKLSWAIFIHPVAVWIHEKVRVVIVLCILFQFIARVKYYTILKLIWSKFCIFVLLNFQELKLRRNAINFLAFLGASGKSGFDILLNHRLPKGTNFFAIILQSLVSDLDLEAFESAQLPEVFRNRYDSAHDHAQLCLYEKIDLHYKIFFLSLIKGPRIYFLNVSFYAIGCFFFFFKPVFRTQSFMCNWWLKMVLKQLNENCKDWHL